MSGVTLSVASIIMLHVQLLLIVVYVQCVYIVLLIKLVCISSLSISLHWFDALLKELCLNNPDNLTPEQGPS